MLDNLNINKFELIDCFFSLLCIAGISLQTSHFNIKHMIGVCMTEYLSPYIHLKENTSAFYLSNV